MNTQDIREQANKIVKELTPALQDKRMDDNYSVTGDNKELEKAIRLIFVPEPFNRTFPFDKPISVKLEGDKHYKYEYAELNSSIGKILALIDSQILQARNETQSDIAKHIEEYHYHKLNDVLIGNATIEQLIAESKDRLSRLTKQQEGK